MAMYTEEQVRDAVTYGADMVAEAVGGNGDKVGELLDMVVNAALTRLENPTADFQTVVDECYGGDDPREGGWDYSL